MNIFVLELASDKLEATEVTHEVKVEDNIGESIHIHYRNVRLELSIDDFNKLAKEFSNAKKELENGHR